MLSSVRPFHVSTGNQATLQSDAPTGLTPMAKHETEEHLLSSYPPEPPDGDADLRQREAQLKAAQRKFRWVSYSSYGLFGIAFCLFAATWILQRGERLCSELECAKVTSPYSPLWDAVEFWEGDFVNYFNHSTIYRGPPTAEREAAWDELWNVPGISIDQAGIDALNKSQPGQQYAQSLESTPERLLYASSPEVVHHIHCLNLIRQATWPLSLFDKSWPTYPELLDDKIGGRLHVDHCIETLRLSIMCYSDITPILTLLAPDRPTGFQLDFNVHHKCRNFDKITQYLVNHGTDVDLDKIDRNG